MTELLQASPGHAIEATGPSENAGHPLQSTRVFVSGLPSKLTNDQLAAHFASHFRVTDAHVLADRRIGFVGFPDSTSALKAIQHFNKTYIRMSKIAVDLAKPVELLQTSGASVPISHRGFKVGKSELSKKRKRSRGDDGEELREQNDTVKEDLKNGHQDVEDEVDTKLQHSMTDNDWLRGRTSRTLDLVDADDSKCREDADSPEESFKTTAVEANAESSSSPQSKEPQTVKVPNARLFLRNLAFSVTEPDLQSHFERFGKIQEVRTILLFYVSP